MAVFGELQAPQIEIVSPELALVDPSLAACARATLPEPSDMLSKDDLRADPDREQTGFILAHHVSVMEGETAAALRRITELSEVEPPEPGRRYRVAKFAGAVATWSAFAILIADLGLLDWSSLLSH